MDENPKIKPSLMIIMNGGLIQGVISDHPESFEGVELAVVDFDCEGTDEEDVLDVGVGDDAYCYGIDGIGKSTLDYDAVVQKLRPDDFFAQFDGLEVSPCQEFDSGEGKCVERIDRKDVSLHEDVFWSVYGHFSEGHVRCLQDFPDEGAAMAYAKGLLDAYSNLAVHGILTY